MAKAEENKTVEVADVHEMKLSIMECLKFKELLPLKGSILTLVLSKDIKKKTSLTQSDFKKYAITEISGTGGLKWEDERDIIPVIFTAAEIEFLKKQISESDKQKTITIEILDLCIKIRDC